MVTARLHPRPAGLPEAVKWCGWCGTATHKSYLHKCDGSQPHTHSAKLAPPDHPGLAKVSKYRATPTHVDGIRFASKTEAALYEWAKSLKYPIIVPHVRFPLYALTSPGIAATWFTPDLLIGDGEDVLEAWEAKGARACESRDYALRARAFRLSFPSIRLRVFRKVGGEFVEDNQSARAEGG